MAMDNPLYMEAFIGKSLMFMVHFAAMFDDTRGYKVLPARLPLAAFGSRVGSHVRQLIRLIDGLVPMTGGKAPQSDMNHGMIMGYKLGLLIYMGDDIHGTSWDHHLLNISQNH